MQEKSTEDKNNLYLSEVIKRNNYKKIKKYFYLLKDNYQLIFTLLAFLSIVFSNMFVYLKLSELKELTLLPDLISAESLSLSLVVFLVIFICFTLTLISVLLSFFRTTNNFKIKEKIMFISLIGLSFIVYWIASYMSSESKNDYILILILNFIFIFIFIVSFILLLLCIVLVAVGFLSLACIIFRDVTCKDVFNLIFNPIFNWLDKIFNEKVFNLLYFITIASIVFYFVSNFICCKVQYNIQSILAIILAGGSMMLYFVSLFSIVFIQGVKKDLIIMSFISSFGFFMLLPYALNSNWTDSILKMTHYIEVPDDSKDYLINKEYIDNYLVNNKLKENIHLEGNKVHGYFAWNQGNTKVFCFKEEINNNRECLLIDKKYISPTLYSIKTTK